MLFSLSLKNIRKSIKDYSIYFFTLLLGVCIFYVFNAIGDQTAMMELSGTKSRIVNTMNTALSGMSVVVSLILGFLIVYASRFLIRRRKKELGIYLTLGMRRSAVIRILLTETILIGLLSLGAGLLIGIGLSQFMSLFVANMFEADMSRFVFTISLAAVGKTICYFVIIYLVVIVMNIVVVARSRLIRLLVAERVQEKVHLKNPAVSFFLFLAACGMLAFAYYNVAANQEAMETQGDVMLQLILGIAGTFLIFWSVSGFVLAIVKKIPGIYNRRLNSFVLGEVSARINTSAAAGSIICLLLFATICILSAAFTLKADRESRMENQVPVDVCMWRSVPEGTEYDTDESVRAVLEEKGFDMEALDVRGEFVIYKRAEATKGAVMGSFMERLLERDPTFQAMAENPVEIIRGGDYNRAAGIYGFEPVKLGPDQYAVSCDYPSMQEFFNQGLMENDTVEICGRTLKAAYPECVEGYIQMSYSESNMGLLVVPDDLPLTEQDVFQSCLISDYTPEYDNRDFYSWMDDGGFEEQINAGLTDTESGSGQEDQGVVQISTRSRIYDDSVGSSAMAVFIALYLGFVFIVSGAAILALKEMSDAIDSREKYRILRQLGAGEKEVNRALVIQMGIFFGFPLLLAAVHSVFGIQVSYTMLGIYASVDSLPPLIIAAVLIGILYGGYFAVSYLCCRRVIGE